MVDLDDRLRAELIQLVEPVPTAEVAARVAQRRRRRRRGRRLALTGLATALLVGAGAGALVLQDDSADVATQEAPPDPTAGWQIVSFHGVELRVPGDWPIGAIECGTPVGDTVIIDLSAVNSCLHPAPEEPVTVVWIDEIGSGLRDEAQALASEDVVVDGIPGRRGRGILPDRNARVDVLVIPDRDVAIVIESEDLALAAQILDSVRIREVDQHGCPTSSEPRTAPPTPSSAGAADKLVPGAPVRVIQCRYQGGWLERSAPPRAGDQLAGLVSLLNGLPEGVSLPPAGSGWDGSCPPGQDGCQMSIPQGYVLTFEYDDHDPVVVDVRVAPPGDLRATNGLRSTKLSPDLVFHLGDVLGYSGAIPDPRTLG